MADEETLFQRRQRAPNHFWGRAEDARFAAWYLWQGSEQEPALKDAYRREASLALELIIKAVIAQHIENGTDALERKAPPTSHSLTDLWKSAGLSPLAKPDHARLIDAKHRLIWAGRYPTPKRESDYDLEEKESRPYRQVVARFKGRDLTQGWSFDWEDFDRIYQIAADAFAKIAPYIDDDGFLIFPEGYENHRGRRAD